MAKSESKNFMMEKLLICLIRTPIMDAEIESKINWKSNTLECKEKTIHYYSYINGTKPFFFFLHGITDNGLCYDRVAESFADQFNIIMPDARGHGKSSDPSKKCSFLDMAIDIKDICEHLKIDEIYVLGHSMGGAQAAVFASMFADHVKAVILEDPAIVMHKSISMLMKIAIPFLSIFTVFSNKNTQSPKKPKKERPIEKYIKKSEKINKKWSRHDQLIWAKAQQEFSHHSLAKAMKMIIRRIPLWKGVLTKIRVPVLLLTSQHGIIRKHTAKKLKKIKSDLSWVYVPKAGHNIRREQYEIEIKAIKDFLKF